MLLDAAAPQQMHSPEPEDIADPEIAWLLTSQPPNSMTPLDYDVALMDIEISYHNEQLLTVAANEPQIDQVELENDGVDNDRNMHRGRDNLSPKLYISFGDRRSRSPQSKGKSPKSTAKSKLPKSVKSASKFGFESDHLAAFSPVRSDAEIGDLPAEPADLAKTLTSPTSSFLSATDEKTPLKGITKLSFDGPSVFSPYLEHLKHGNKPQVLSKKPSKSAVKAGPSEVVSFSKGNRARAQELSDRKIEMLKVYKKNHLIQLPRIQHVMDEETLAKRRSILEELKGEALAASSYRRRSYAAFPSSQAMESRSGTASKSVIMDIDYLLTTYNLPSDSRARGTARNHPNICSHQQFTGEHGAETKSSALADNMLSNMHLDPLYRIMREEVERLRREDAAGTSSSSSSSEKINAADIKVLNCFQSLPPAVWVTCRIVYYLLIAYYQTIIAQPEFEEYRRLQQIDTLWACVERQVQNDGISMASLSKQFSWPCLQELMKYPGQFAKALDFVEKGVRLHPTQWIEFHTMLVEIQQQQATAEAGAAGGASAPPRGILTGHTVSKSNGCGSTGEKSSALANVISNESSERLFYERFPEHGFAGLRELVKAGKSALLTDNKSSIKASTGKVHVYSTSQNHCPGSFLATAASLTSWLKRVIATLYVNSIHRARSDASASQGPTSHGTMTDRLSKPRLPSGLSFAAILNGFQYKHAFNRLRAFVQSSLSLVKPRDQLDLLLLPLLDPKVVADLPSMQGILEQHLRMTTASPLHRVALIPQQQQPSSDPLAAYLHPGLLHCIHRSNASGSPKLDLFLAELKLHTPEPFVFIPQDGHRLGREQLLRAKLKFSLALMSTQEPSLILPQPIAAAEAMSVDSTLRGHRYVVCVTDTPHSWNAFRVTQHVMPCLLLSMPDVCLTSAYR